MDSPKIICDPNLSKRVKTSFMDAPYGDLFKQKCEGVKIQRFMPKDSMPKNSMPNDCMPNDSMPKRDYAK